MHSILLIIFFLFLGNICVSQETGTKRDTLFLKGIYFENINVTVPWEIDISRLEKYGSPKVEKYKSYFVIKWDSVKFLNKFTVNFFVTINKRELKLNKIKKIGSFKAVIDSLMANEMTVLFKDYSNGYKARKNHTYYTRWTFNNCRVFIGCDMGIYYLEISKIGR